MRRHGDARLRRLPALAARASRKPTTAATAKATAAAPQTQRGPRRRSAARDDHAEHEHAKFVLMSTVKARPRSGSGAPRWTSSALQTTAAPFPAPETTHADRGDPDVRRDGRGPMPNAISTSETP